MDIAQMFYKYTQGLDSGLNIEKLMMMTYFSENVSLAFSCATDEVCHYTLSL